MSAPVTTAWDALAERFQSIYENASLLYKIIIKVVIFIYIYIYIYMQQQQRMKEPYKELTEAFNTWFTINRYKWLRWLSQTTYQNINLGPTKGNAVYKSSHDALN